MKNLILFIISLSLLLLLILPIKIINTVILNHQNFSYPISHSPLDFNLKTKSNNPDVGKANLEKSEWYANTLSQIKQMEYEITYDNENEIFQSPNRSNNLRFTYFKNGFKAQPRINKIPLFDENNKLIREEDKKYKDVPDWSLIINAVGINRKPCLENIKESGRDVNNFSADNSDINHKSTDLNSLSSINLNVNGNKAFIENESVRIDYENNSEGMRQNFVLKQRPAGKGLLKINLSVTSKLKMVTDEENVSFRNSRGKDIMKYTSLKAWDANGKVIRSYFEKECNEKNSIANSCKYKSKIKCSESKYFSIVIDDKDAAYPLTIDPLSTSANWYAEINQAEASFGINVATAGDVNGDGYSDVIVGANTYDNTGFNNGAAFVYYGSASGLSASPNWSRTTTQYSAEFGNDVATAGDVNGDGYSDVIVGSYRYTNTFSDEGAAFVYYGPLSGTSGGANWVAYGGQTNAYFGISVSTAGDVNINGCSDIVIGAYQFDASPYTDNGRAFVYFGTVSGLTGPWTFDGSQNSEGLGSSVSTAGDADNSGGSDIIIGAYNYSNGQTGEGRVYIFTGAPGLNYFPNSPYTIESNSAGANFGVSVSTAGDVNGNGISDIIVGAYHYTNGQFQEGRAYLYLGNWLAAPTASVWSVEGNQAGMAFGLAVSTAGDVNGDGYGDVIIGAPYYDGSFTDEGSAYIYYGNNSAAGLSLTPNWTVTGGQTDAEYGFSVSIAGDVNGDGISDVITGAPYFDGIQTNCGRAFVYYGSPSGLSLTSNWSKIGAPPVSQINSDFGISVCTAGDINNDGFADVVIGAPSFDVGTNKGKIFICLGSVSGFTTVSYSISPSESYFNSFGNSVATAGDVNGDGYGDIIVGAPSYTNPQVNEGKSYLYYGYQYGLYYSGWSKEGGAVNANFGNSVASAGDVNGDGFADIIVGAYRYTNDQTEEGRAYLFLGSSSGPSINPDWTTEGDFAYAQYGTSVATAGDVNGDGYNDVLVGAPSYNNTVTGGRAYLYYGTSSGLSASAGWVTQAGISGQAFSSYGWSVACAGDVDGNGCTDILVGALYVYNGASYGGKVYAYYGNASGVSTTPSWTYTNAPSLTQFASSVSTAGDVNGDGYSDIIIGEPAYSNIQVNKGKVYVFHGSKTGLLSAPAWTAEGTQNNEAFGSCVCTAGDVNGDGYSDVIVGAYHYQSGANYIGAVFAYYGNDGISRRELIRQYKPNSYSTVYSGGYTGSYQAARFNITGVSPFGKSKGRIVYENKISGQSFSTGTDLSITNSTASSGSGAYTYMAGTYGTPLNQDVTGLSFFLSKETKWRARVQYDVYTNPYQKYGPWKYYTNYIPLPNWSLRPTYHQWMGVIVNVSFFMEGYYNKETKIMRKADTVTVYIHNSVSPYQALDSAVSVINENGSGTFEFYRKSPCKDPPRKIKVKQKNCIETWASGNLECTDSAEQHYDFTFAAGQAFGNNMKMVDTEPVTFAIYSGDVNQDGTIDGGDLSMIDNDSFNFVKGNVVTDLTGDEIVDASDGSIADNNAANFVSVISP